jgi:hypothetical protein
MVESSGSSSGGSSPAELWQRVGEAILASPGAHAEQPELEPLLDKVRRHAYRIVDADVEGLDADLVLESVLATAFGVADGQLRAALAAIE